MKSLGGAAVAGGIAAEASNSKNNSPTHSDVPIAIRKNLNETAFFFPHAISNEEGEVNLTFTMPEALTEWKLMAFAHDAETRSGFIDGKTVTSLDLMVRPNPPRFLREGDVLEFTTRVLNSGKTDRTGIVKLSLKNANTEELVNKLLGNKSPEISFTIPAGESRSFSWRLTVPDRAPTLLYQVTASADDQADGEENYLPVLSRRILVTESLPLPIRNKGTKKFQFEKLLTANKSNTLEHQSLTVQVASNPAWYAVLALPYLMEYPHNCAEQQFNRLYANLLASHIANSDTKIRRVFDLWKGTDALDSPLEKNEELKNLLLLETPWVSEAKNESQARRNVGILFDNNRLNTEVNRLFDQLNKSQNPDGGWSWMPGGRSNDYITLYITTGFGRLRHLGVKNVNTNLAIKALTHLDNWIQKRYNQIEKRKQLDTNNLSTTVSLYLYCRSFYLKDKPIAAGNKKAFNYFVKQGKKYWLKLRNRQSKAHIAIALHRLADKQTPGDIVKSILEYSVTNEELGMYWRDTEYSWWWYRAPIETQAMMIEMFNEISDNKEAVRECQIWLIKQKQTQAWKTTKATADAVYSILLGGDNLLASTKLVDVSLGGSKVKPKNVEAGTGFYEQKFDPSEIKSELGLVEMTKHNSGVAWGSLHWQYLEDMSKVTPHTATPLRLSKEIYIRENEKIGKVLKPIDRDLKPGDELLVRLILRSDRDMEFVHLKDQRGSGTEPVNVLSRYKYQDGLAYYESTRDASSHFFIDYLPKGNYVFEYPVKVFHRGRYQSGIANIQSMYAPEFNSHSASYWLEVK
ncbi:MAG: alpha-2-macroglobulin family protein [Opitutia bacterium TMED67]|nr:alpha-2-macroglobulin family protein [Verrucomicrobiales bacterium]OUU70413.1 MAG: alpha-2-macroglobulin family protein [Opitutae bacterium TMED67]